MTYNPNIPDLPNEITQDVPRIQQNFQLLDSLYNLDHYGFSDATDGGLHKKLSFADAQPSDPALSGNAGIFFPKEDQNDSSARTQLFWKNITETLQVTNRFHAAADPGWIQLPGGIIILWAFQAIDTDPVSPGAWSQTHNVNFNAITNYVYPSSPSRGFPNNLFAAVANVCNQDVSPSPKTVAIDQANSNRTRIRIKLSSLDITGIYYIAIGN